MFAIISPWESALFQVGHTNSEQDIGRKTRYGFEVLKRDVF